MRKVMENGHVLAVGLERENGQWTMFLCEKCAQVSQC